ncbi:MAG: FHA domain-containing protein [Polyangia bacterium]|jgi:adenylate cyclase|nr:FHA domain-containing protein [Polyangia bacterium]
MTKEHTRVSASRHNATLVVKRRSMLRVVRGAGAGTEVLLDNAAIRAGRADEADLIIDDPAASRQHFEVSPYHGGFTLRDLGSTNGTEVNRVLVLECRLSNGDIITVGETDVVFVEKTDVDEPAPE